MSITEEDLLALYNKQMTEKFTNLLMYGNAWTNEELKEIQQKSLKDHAAPREQWEN